jgi:hypothetical protein
VSVIGVRGRRSIGLYALMREARLRAGETMTSDARLLEWRRRFAEAYGVTP